MTIGSSSPLRRNSRGTLPSLFRAAAAVSSDRACKNGALLLELQGVSRIVAPLGTSFLLTNQAALLALDEQQTIGIFQKNLVMIKGPGTAQPGVFKLNTCGELVMLEYRVVGPLPGPHSEPRCISNLTLEMNFF